MKMILAATVVALTIVPAAAQNGNSTAMRASESSSEVAPDKSLVAEGRADANSNDPNRLICRRDKVAGSRINAKRTCATAAQWSQWKFDQREVVERIQKDRPATGN
jgi:hypothetical protein